MAVKTTSLWFTQVAKHTAVVVVPVLIILVQTEIARTVISSVTHKAWWSALACVANLKVVCCDAIDIL